MNDDAITDASPWIDGHVRIYLAVLADCDTCPHDASRADPCLAADTHVLVNDHPRIDGDSFVDRDGFMQNRGGMNSRPMLDPGLKKLCSARKWPSRSTRPQPSRGG